jgi:hypothetical protein
MLGRSALAPLLPTRAVARGLLVAALTLSAGTTAAQPVKVGELLAVCERGIAAGNVGVDAAACDWLAVPCECKSGRSADGLPRWCLPDSASVDAAMLAVVGALRRYPDRDADAEPVVADILSRLYPCD